MRRQPGSASRFRSSSERVSTGRDAEGPQEVAAEMALVEEADLPRHIAGGNGAFQQLPGARQADLKEKAVRWHPGVQAEEPKQVEATQPHAGGQLFQRD